MKKKHVNILLPRSKNLGKRVWGEEKLLVLIPKILSLKILKIKKGKKGGLQYHQKKNECGYLISGKLIVRFDKGNGKISEKILKPGSVYHFRPGSVHQTEAITTCTIIEASSPHFNDRVRVENKYGLKYKGGLPSTLKNKIVLK